jgi:hypothetical protein
VERLFLTGVLFCIFLCVFEYIYAELLMDCLH